VTAETPMIGRPGEVIAAGPGAEMVAAVYRLPERGER